ncbi:hypothetical protein ELE36_12420 [Pseudolysobacter antarcticus]|uniref:Uncharacterized protein n=1 Tax=Pseudolysobacter antarcticus TaxID=2511995 RepID=A0A411HKS0_9GAMM|nr:hypothetical protein [Pseudolysobacter antarcticus]QBB71091.1 hypothetical protein ELE36_12420 [Pseudolysobacter antarcticus]
MFKFLLKFKQSGKRSTPAPAFDKLAGAENLSDEGLTRFLREAIASQNSTFGALFLVAVANWRYDYIIMKQVVQFGLGFTDSLEGYAQFQTYLLEKHRSNTLEDEIARRAIIYRYLAALTHMLTFRARKRPELWDDVADFWVAVLPGARAIRRTIEETALWRADDTKEFSEVTTEVDGENYCLRHLLPQEIRSHAKINEWREKDWSHEQRAEMEQLDAEIGRMINGPR